MSLRRCLIVSIVAFALFRAPAYSQSQEDQMGVTYSAAAGGYIFNSSVAGVLQALADKRPDILFDKIDIPQNVYLFGHSFQVHHYAEGDTNIQGFSCEGITSTTGDVPAMSGVGMNACMVRGRWRVTASDTGNGHSFELLGWMYAAKTDDLHTPVAWEPINSNEAAGAVPSSRYRSSPDQEAHSSGRQAFDQALAILATPSPLAPSQPLRAYGRPAQNVTAPRPSRYAMATPDVSLAPVPSSSHSAQSSYHDHPDLEAPRCLSFHGPIDIYGERVTNSCGYTVAYAFCVDGGNTALACKSGGDDISGGADTIGGGKTQDTGWVGAAGHEIHTFWHACRGKLGDVSPVMRTRNLGACMSY